MNPENKSSKKMTRNHSDYRSSFQSSWKKRMAFLGLILILSGGCLYYFTKAFRDNLVFFVTPTELMGSVNESGYAKDNMGYNRNHIQSGKTLRLGGLVKQDSVDILDEKERVLVFTVTDFENDLVVHYQGFLPDLFREGQGVVAEGTYDQTTHVFNASKILAKHDESYRPPEVKRALKPTATTTLKSGGTKLNGAKQ